MMQTTNREHKEAYNEAAKLNRIGVRALLKLHNVRPNTLDCWRWMEGRYPPFYALYELHRYIKKAGLESSRKLDRIFRIEDKHIKEIAGQ